MNHSDMKPKSIGDNCTMKGIDVAFAAKEENYKILFLYLFWYQGMLKLCNKPKPWGEPTLTLSFLRGQLADSTFLGAVTGGRLREPWAYPDGKAEWPFAVVVLGIQ